MSKKRPRIEREGKTVGIMISLYCCANHQFNGLCSECIELRDYAVERLDKCALQEGKTTCAKCPIHCYKPDMREKIRKVMRYSGPRMTFRHPIMALWHLKDGRRNKPVKPIHDN